jgi:[ribosomal protein S5]-alanine N-acetyltransferase
MTEFFLTSSRLGFRSWTAEDLPLALALWGNSDVAHFIHVKGAFSREEVIARLAREMEMQRQCGIQYWPMFLLATDAFIGCCGLRPYQPRPGTLELGVHLLPDFWRQGLAQEATRCVIDHAFETLKVSALFAGHHPGNQASRELLTRLGFEYTHDEFYAPTGLQHPSYLMTNPGMKNTGVIA